MAKNKQKILYIQFDDPASVDGWLTKDELVQVLEENSGDNEAVGWLVKETKKHVYISAHIGCDKYSASLRVPKSIIHKRKTLK